LSETRPICAAVGSPSPYNTASPVKMQKPL
jgi:hypothetical protein